MTVVILPQILKEKLKNSLPSQQNNNLNHFKGCKFSRWELSEDKHRELYKAGKCGCFNCKIGWAVKENTERPLYPWQKEIVSAFDNYKLVSILKARSVGATELCLRYFFWKCVVDDRQRGKSIIILTGIRELLAIELIRRFKALAPNLEWNTREGVAELNGCRLSAYPSMKIKDIRGAAGVSHILIDELDWFEDSVSSQIFSTVEPLIWKSNPQIILVSTPGKINSPMYELYNQPASKCRYHRLYVPVTKVVGKNNLISEQEHETMKRLPFYKQEALLQFGSYATGTIFNIEDINFAVQVGQQYNNVEYNPIAAKSPYPYINTKAEVHAIGCDPGFGHSKFGLSMISLFDDRLHVIVAEAFDKPDEDDIIQKILSLRQKTGRPHQTKIYVDASNNSFIRRMKASIPGERTDYEEYISELRRRKLLYSSDESEMVNYMSVVPVSFSKHGSRLLETLYTHLQQGNIAISPKHSTLIAALQSARNVPGRRSQFVLDKSSQSMDVLDSLKVALFNFEAGAGASSSDIEEEDKEEVEEEITVS